MKSKTRVVHINTCGIGEDYTYIGRPTKWGNPFKIPEDGSREEVIEKYKEWFKGQFHLHVQLYQLKGRKLACWCKPLPCHGDILAECAENPRRIGQL